MKAINMIGKMNWWQWTVMLTLAVPLYVLSWVIALLTFRGCSINIELGKEWLK